MRKLNAKSVRAAPHRLSSWETKRTVAPRGTGCEMCLTVTAVRIHGLAGRGGDQVCA